MAIDEVLCKPLLYAEHCNGSSAEAGMSQPS